MAAVTTIPMKFKDDVLVLIGAAVGALVGYFAFWWVYHQGFYGLVLPGGLLGCGAGISKSRSKLIPVICGLSALALGLLTEWQRAPFANDGSLGFFLTHVHHKLPITLIMIAAGAALGFWIPFRRRQDLVQLETIARQQ
jgi:hypothetical protein